MKRCCLIGVTLSVFSDLIAGRIEVSRASVPDLISKPNSVVMDFDEKASARDGMFTSLTPSILSFEKPDDLIAYVKWESEVSCLVIKPLKQERTIAAVLFAQFDGPGTPILAVYGRLPNGNYRLIRVKRLSAPVESLAIIGNSSTDDVRITALNGFSLIPVLEISGSDLHKQIDGLQQASVQDKAAEADRLKVMKSNEAKAPVDAAKSADPKSPTANNSTGQPVAGHVPATKSDRNSKEASQR